MTTSKKGASTSQGLLEAVSNEPLAATHSSSSSELEHLKAELAAERRLRIRAETALAASERRFQDFASVAADWFWETDAEERVTYLSQRWEEIFQRPRATAIGDFRHENLRRLNASLEQERAYNDTIAKREAFDGFDVEVREDTGKQRFFRLSAQPWFDEQGEFGGYRGTGLDITTERTASLAKRQLAGQLEAVVKHSQSLIFFKDTEGRYVLTNPEFDRLHALTPDSALGKVASDIFEPELAAKFAAHDRATESAGTATQREITFDLGEGITTILVAKFPVHDDEGELLGFGAVGTDITELKRIERELRESETLLRGQTSMFESIFEHVPDAILFASPDRHIQIANQRACELFRYDSESFRGVPVRQLYAQEEDWLTVSNDDYLTVDTVRSDKAIRYVRADGTEFWGEVIRVTVLHPDEGVRGHLGIIRDVTARLEAELEWEQMEAQLRQSQKMQAIGQLTGGIAHDFNNILASVIGYTKLARDRCVDDPNGKLARYLAEVTKASERARDLVSQMLTFSRGGTGESVALDLAPLVEDALNLMRSTMPASMTFTLETGDRLPQIALDAVQVQQLLMNLCINARDAMEGYGQVTLSLGVDVFEDVSCASCRDDFGGEMLTLRVTDTGDGVEPDLLNRLFEPFFSTKQVGAGSGMGLAMVHGIVHRHGGHISLDSTPGNGFSIGLHFPTIWSEPSTSPPKDEEGLYEFVGEGNHIIVVDDERAVRTYLSDLLSGYGFTVESFASGTSAAKRIEYTGKCPDLLITDQTMPGMTGDALVAQLRDRWPALPVILCTGHSETVTENDVLAWGNSGYLAKPIPTSRLTWLLSTLLPDK